MEWRVSGTLTQPPRSLQLQPARSNPVTPHPPSLRPPSGAGSAVIGFSLHAPFRPAKAAQISRSERKSCLSPSAPVSPSAAGSHEGRRCNATRPPLGCPPVKEQTLAEKLGATVHVSSLLRKARRLGLRLPKDLCTLAVQRGCRHYWQGDEPAGELVPQSRFSNEELAIALLNGAGTYSPHSVRCGAAMLGALGNNPVQITKLAVRERTEIVVRFIAECARGYEPENPYWSQLLDLLPACPPPRAGVLPHPTRFVALNGYQRGVGKKLTAQWQRPQKTAVAS